MKKDKKREVTIEQLEKKKDILDKVAMYSSIVAICITIGTIFILSIICVITGITFSFEYVFSRFALVLLAFVIIMIIILKFCDRYEAKIKIKKKNDKINGIKQMSSCGDIKEKVTLKDKTLTNAILSNNIDRVVFREINSGAIIPKDADCTIELYLKDGSLLQSFFSMEDFLKLINRASKARMLNHLIKSIKIENSETEINAENFSYKEKVTDDELIDMFEIKE